MAIRWEYDWPQTVEFGRSRFMSNVGYVRTYDTVCLGMNRVIPVDDANRQPMI